MGRNSATTASLRRRTFLAGAGAVAATLPAVAGAGRVWAQSGELQTVRVASLRYGSFQWLLDTMIAEKLPQAQGIEIAVRKLASSQAGPIALLSGEADIIVSDWPWAMRQLSNGENVRFAPYSSALGAVMVAPDSKFKTLADLKGKRIGVAGSELDKSWIMLRAYAKQQFGIDLSSDATPVFGAPPLLTEETRSGRLDAVLNFWTYTSRLKGAGFRELIGMDAVVEGLGIFPPPPMIGYVWTKGFEDKNPDALNGYLKAVDAANELLASSDDAWSRVRGDMKAKTEAEFESLRQTYRKGIPDKGWTSAHTKSAEDLLKLLRKLGAGDLIGAETKFDPKLFHGTA